LARNSKTTLSPDWAVTLGGVKVNPPSPTRTLRSAAETTMAAAMAMIAEKCILKKEQAVIKYRKD